MTAPGHSSLRAAGGRTVGWDESLHDLKTHWAVGQGFVPLTQRSQRKGPGDTILLQQQRGGGTRKQLCCLGSEEVQVVCKDDNGDSLEKQRKFMTFVTL